MKKVFTRKYIFENCGCYSVDRVGGLSFISKPKIPILDIVNSEVSLKDKGWFLMRKCKLTSDQKKRLAYLLALSVLPIFEKKNPDDKRVRECLEAIQALNEGRIIGAELYVKRRAAYGGAAAAAYADAAAAAAYAAAAAAYAAAYGAVGAADAAVDAAAYTAYAAAYGAYEGIVLQVMIDFCSSEI